MCCIVARCVIAECVIAARYIEAILLSVLTYGVPRFHANAVALFVGVDLFGCVLECPRLIGASVPVLDGDVGAVCCRIAGNVQCAIAGCVQKDKLIIFGKPQLPELVTPTVFIVPLLDIAAVGV